MNSAQINEHRAIEAEEEYVPGVIEANTRLPGAPAMSSAELLDIALNASDVEMRKLAIRTLCLNSAIDILRQP